MIAFTLNGVVSRRNVFPDAFAVPKISLAELSVSTAVLGSDNADFMSPSIML